MFGFLKKKLSGALKAFTKKVEEETQEPQPETQPDEQHLEHERPIKPAPTAPPQAQESPRKKKRPKPEKTPPHKKQAKQARKQARQTEPKQEQHSIVLDKEQEQRKKPTLEASQTTTATPRPPPPTPKKPAPYEQPPKPQETTSEPSQQTKSEQELQEEKGTSFFGRLKEAFTHTTLSPEKFENIFWDLELALLENNVAVEVIEKIKNDLKDELTNKKHVKRNLEQAIKQRLKQSISELFDVPTFQLENKIKQKKPFIITFIGVNGSGKTTNMAKLAHRLQQQGFSVVMAAADTFRAAAIQQLEEHATKLGIKLIKHEYGSDPAAVAYDAIAHARSKKIDVVLIDTAGRLHSNDNLMNELQKLIRVNKPDLTIFVAEATTGNDAVEQARLFNERVGIDAIILAKTDVDEKGGAAISISYITKKPILFIGTGQGYNDLQPFTPETILHSLEL
ncbi:signal recognition particle-docking protein FtsY [Candidatus Woesearchaeota archaeon]|nr:MAG: signal recognition particle-docking protein FtsY [Candidatus Woesearchaeota archaeon]